MPPVSMDFDLADSSVTDALGQALARAYPGAAAGAAGGEVGAAAALAGTVHAAAPPEGAVVYLHGELGAGKTTCVRSLLRALGVTGLVRSPTYTLVETYELGTLTCIHVDLYRVQTLTEVDELGLRDLVGPECLLLVEWPERGSGALPPADVDLMLRYAGDARQASLRSQSEAGSAWLRNLGRDTSLRFYVSNLT
jgi:tRNA threonylcarbamoyladenosine biosynthesis protein TsaE